MTSAGKKSLFAATVLASWLACGVATASTPFQEGRPGERAGDRVGRLLSGPIGEGDSGRVGRDLAAAGPEAVPVLFGILQSGSFEAPDERGDRSLRKLGAAHERAILDAFARLPGPAVRAHLAERSRAQDAGDDARRAALRILGHLGRAGDLDLIGACAVGRPGARLPRTVRSELETTLARVFDRDPAAVRNASSLYARGDGALVAPVVTALQSSADGERLVALAGLLGRLPAGDAHVLVAIGKVARAVARPDARVTAAVRRYLRGQGPQLTTEAALAAGALMDRDAIPPLIDLLETGEPTVAAAALRSLEGMSSQPVGRSPERWRNWYSAERSWWRTEAPQDFLLVRGGAPADASRVILELSKHRLWRHELVEPLAAGLDREEIELAALTCAALGHLGSPLAVEPLIRALERPELDVQQAAWRALRRVTGLELGATPAEWRARVGEG